MCYKSGILSISEVLDVEGNILTDTKIKGHCTFDFVKFLGYLKLYRAVNG